MKTKSIFGATLLAISGFLFIACNSDDMGENEALGEPVTMLNVSAEGVSTFAVNNICPVLTTTDPLTADEIEFLYAIREDEKLARDVTETFKALYPTSKPFANISVAEATHISAIERLLSYYEISYPALAQVGVFSDETRQAQYNTSIVQGVTLLDAYKVTALLEEEGIVAYNTVLPNIANANIKLLVENIIKASSNHLRAYVNKIGALGGSYTPTVLDQAAFDAITHSAFCEGNKYEHQGGKHGKGGNTNSEKGGHAHGNKGNVNSTGTCTNTCTGSAPRANGGKGEAGKGYRGGR